MSAPSMKEVFERAKTDKEFFSALLRDPRAALSGETYDLTEDEMTRLETAINDARAAGDALTDLLGYAEAGSMEQSLTREPPWGWDA